MSELTLSMWEDDMRDYEIMWRDDMRYYEIRDMDERTSEGYRTRMIDEDELKRRIDKFRVVHMPYNECIQILLHGKVNEELPDPWEEWAEGAANAIVGSEPRADWTYVKDALLKLKTLVEKNTGCDSTPSKR